MIYLIVQKSIVPAGLWQALTPRPLMYVYPSCGCAHMEMQSSQLKRLLRCVQNQFLAQLRQRHLEQQQQQQMQMAPDLARQQELQQRVLSGLNPQQLQQLQALPKVPPPTNPF
jgi:hypothetical protein